MTGDKTADNILGTLFGNGSNNGGILGPTAAAISPSTAFAIEAAPEG